MLRQFKRQLTLETILVSIMLLLAACGSERGIINLEVGLDYQFGGVQPVARKQFYLLDGNLIDLLGGNSQESRAALWLWRLTAFETNYQSDKRAELEKIFQEHAVARATTDLQGKASFSPVSAGTYYIVGWSKVRKEDELVIWNYQVEVTPGEQKVSLSSSDAATVAMLIPNLREP